MKKILFILMLISPQAFAGVVSYDQLAASADLTVSKWNADMSRIYDEFGGNTEDANLAADTLTERVMADDINPRVRTFEGASCEKVDDGLQPATDSDLTSDISAGTAYPRGFRCDKTSATSKTYTASKWTYVDIDQNCDFQYSEVAIDASAPSVATNSIRLARVSTDSTTINTVTDLRTTSCSAGPFHVISDSTSESSLSNVFAEGQPVRRFSIVGRTPDGLARGLFVSYDTHTTFNVTSGVAYINGLYRHISSDISVGTGNDDPANGTSGLDTGAIAASTTYYVYAVGDQDDTSDLTISYSTSSSAPTGVTNARLLGIVKTDPDTLFKSKDLITVHGINEEEIIGGSIAFDGTAGSLTSEDAFNVSSITDNGTGDYTVTWDADFKDGTYSCSGMARNGTANTNQAGVVMYGDNAGNPAAGSVILTTTTLSSVTDMNNVSIMCSGDTRR